MYGGTQRIHGRCVQGVNNNFHNGQLESRRLMTTDYVEFRTMYLKGSFILLFYGGILSAFSIFMIVLIMNIWVTLIFILPALGLPLVILIIRAAKVRFGPDYVETITLFGNKKILIKDVNKFGVFFSGQYTWPKVTNQQSIADSEDDELFGHKIYLSKNHEFDLNSFRHREHVSFPYRKELYFKVKQMMESRT
jgi:hypothetical protein